MYKNPTYLNMSIRREINGTERHVPQQAGLRPLVEAEEAELLDDAPRAHLAAARNLAGHLQADLDYF